MIDLHPNFLEKDDKKTFKEVLDSISKQKKEKSNLF